MDKQKWRKENQWLLFLGLLMVTACMFFFAGSSDLKTHSVIRRALQRINEQRSKFFNPQEEVMLDNGLVQLTFAKPGGDLIGIKYNGIENLLDIKNEKDDRGYWDIVWNKKRGEKTNHVDTLQGASYKIIRSDENGEEISFSRKWNVSLNGVIVPLNIDKRYIMVPNYPGFYTYTILERLNGWPGAEISQVRVVYKLRADKFQSMAVSDDRQRIMPNRIDRLNGQPLAYPEAVLLADTFIPQLKGEVDDKYQYSSENKDDKVHGWMSSDPPTGFWIITPSIEFRSSGPMKQELTNHAGPISLAMFLSAHYAGHDAVMQFKDGEAWKKVYGPVSVYLNSGSADQDPAALWSDAKKKSQEKIAEWPFSFPESEDFIKSNQRGSVSGKLLVHDRYVGEGPMAASSAYVGLAAQGEKGSWQIESKGYQFWSEADKKGYFSIKNIIPGTYNLYAYVPGVIGDYKYEQNVIIEPGSEIDLGSLVYEPPRNGPTLWEIGVADRTAAEFFVPSPNPSLMNNLYTNKSIDKFRQYGLWNRYTDLYPNEDLVYTVGLSDYRTDWFFAHVTRNKGGNTYTGTTWQIVFKLDTVSTLGDYTLQLALASAANMELQVRLNDRDSKRPLFTTGLIGGDNAIARHGIHGLYWFYSINVPSNLLVEGNNVIYLTQPRHTGGAFAGLMYDYIRLEGPPQTS